MCSPLCTPSAYSDGEVCDCGCGVVDPDCVFPTPKNASTGILQGRLNISGCPNSPQQQYCDATTASCTTVKPLSNTNFPQKKVMRLLLLLLLCTYLH